MHKLNSQVFKSHFIRSLQKKGLTLIEVLVAVAISLILLSAVLIMVANSAKSSVLQRAQSQMVDTGQFVLNTLAFNIRNAGYQDLIALPSPVLDKEPFGRYLLGCRNQIISSTQKQAPDWGAECTGASRSDAIATRYQGGQLVEVPAVTGNATYATSFQSVDCAGRPITANSEKADRGDGELIAIVDNRFYVEDGKFMCWGNGDKQSWELAPNIAQIRFWYGVSDRTTDSAGFVTLDRVPKRYMTANSLSKIFAGDTSDPWQRVTSVRICVLVRSATEVAGDAYYQYTDCDGVEHNTNPGQAPEDRYLYRAMYTTVEVANSIKGL